MDVHPRELRVVVQHLLEVRHEPFGVSRIAVEAAAQLVVDAAVGHCVQGPARHGQGAAVSARASIAPSRPPQEELDGHWLGEPGRSAPATSSGIEGRLEGGHGLLQDAAVD